MQRRQLKNLKRNIYGIQRTLEDRNEKKKYLREENCQKDLQQRNYLGGWISGTTKNIKEDWNQIGDNGKINK